MAKVIRSLKILMGSSCSIISSLENTHNDRIPAGSENQQIVLVKPSSSDESETRILNSVSFNNLYQKISSESDVSCKMIIQESPSFKNSESHKLRLETNVYFRDPSAEPLTKNDYNHHVLEFKLDNSLPEMVSPKPMGKQLETRTSKFFLEQRSPGRPRELEKAAIKLQKVYKSYRTRRNLADCAVVVEELWWKALDFAKLEQSSVSFFDIDKPQTAISRWARARTRVAKVGKGLSKNEKAQKLALRHWLEAIDPRHRYGHNLHLYYDIWFDSESMQPFFYWLDVGDGKDVNIDKCPRSVLQRQCIEYLGTKERETYEVIVDNGRLVYRQNGESVDTTEGSKWIFVLSTSRSLYVGKKTKGKFQHSSFLSGGATTAAGRLMAKNGVLKAIWPYSGHYLPTEENFREFINFLQENNVDLSNVKRCAATDDNPSFDDETEMIEDVGKLNRNESSLLCEGTKKKTVNGDSIHGTNVGKSSTPKWTNGAGPRIGCVRDYPLELQFKALQQVNLSPRVSTGYITSCGPIPSPRPSPRVRLSPKISCMGLPSPRELKPLDQIEYYPRKTPKINPAPVLKSIHRALS